MSEKRVPVEIPEKLLPLLRPARYKGGYGGRGSAKSHTFATLAVMTNFTRRARGVCIREVQNTLKDSVKQLVEDKIAKYGLTSFFESYRDEIRGANGSLMIFKGMQAYNADNIKSLEDFDWAWTEEAQSLSEVSLRMLRPTIRKDGSELWFSWNPRHDSDPVDVLLRGPNPPANAIVIECNWRDNPWFPAVLQEEMRRDYEADPEMADHVWGGNYEIVSEGAYYAKQIAAAEREGRIGFYPYDPDRLVNTAWDIGVDDNTAIWFLQDDGRTVNVIDYYEVSGDGADEIVKTALPEMNPNPVETKAALIELGRPVPYRYGRHFLPHDVRNREWGSGGRSRIEILAGLGIRNINIGVATNPADRVAAVRKLLPIVRFHRSDRVDMGVKRLRRYRRKWNDALNSYTTPMHDENSHGSDAFGEYAINCGLFPPEPAPEPRKIETRQPTLNEILAENKFGGSSGRI